MSEMEPTSSSSLPIKNPQLTLTSSLKSPIEMDKMEKLNSRQLSLEPYVVLYDISKSNSFSLKNRQQLEQFKFIKEVHRLNSRWSSNTSVNSTSISSLKSSSSGLHFNSTKRTRIRTCQTRNRLLSMNLRSRTQDDTRCSLSISQQRQSIIAKYLSRRKNDGQEEKLSSTDADDDKEQDKVIIEIDKRWSDLLSFNNGELIMSSNNGDDSNTQAKGKSPSSSILLARISETSSSLNITFTDATEGKFHHSLKDSNESVPAFNSSPSPNVNEHNEEELVEKNEPIILKINKNRINDARITRKKHKKNKRKRQLKEKNNNVKISPLNETKKIEEKINESTAVASSIKNDEPKERILKNEIKDNFDHSNGNGNIVANYLQPKIHFYSKTEADQLGILERNEKIIRERKGLPPIVKKVKSNNKSKKKPGKAKEDGIVRKPGRPRKKKNCEKTAVPVKTIVEQLSYVEYEDGRKLPSLPMIDTNSKSTVVAAAGDGDSSSIELKKKHSSHGNLDERKKIIESRKITVCKKNETSKKAAKISENINLTEFGTKKSNKLIDEKKTMTKTPLKIIEDKILRDRLSLPKFKKITSSVNNEEKKIPTEKNRQIHFTAEEAKKRKILHSSEFNAVNNDEINSYGIRTTIPSRQSLLPTKKPLTNEEINDKLLEAFKNWDKIPEIAELLKKPPNNETIKPKISIRDRLGHYVRTNDDDNNRIPKIQPQREMITMNPRKIIPVKPIPMSPFQFERLDESLTSKNIFNKPQLINHHNGISRDHENKLMSLNPMANEQFISPIERAPIKTINFPHPITSDLSAFDRIANKRPLEIKKSPSLFEGPQKKSKTIWKRKCDDSDSEDSSMENTMVDNCSSKSHNTIKSFANSPSSSTMTTESITQRFKKWCNDGKEVVSPIENVDDNSNSCHSLSSVKTIIFTPKKIDCPNSSFSHAINNEEINERMDLEILNKDDSHGSSSPSTSHCSSTTSSTDSSTSKSLVIDLANDLHVNCDEKKDNTEHLSPINSPIKSLIINSPEDSNIKKNYDKQSLSSNSSRKSPVISLCDDLQIQKDDQEEEQSQNKIINNAVDIPDENYNNNKNSINNNYIDDNQFRSDAEDEEKIDDCDVISLYAESIENLQFDNIGGKDQREAESNYSSSSLYRYELMKSENIGTYVSQNVCEFDALYNINENKDDENNNIPNARPKQVLPRVQPSSSVVEQQPQNINNIPVNNNIHQQNVIDHQQFHFQSTAGNYGHNNFINYETQQRFRGYCYNILKRNLCKKCDCKFMHTIEGSLLFLHMGNDTEIKSVMNYAIQEKFFYYLKLVYKNSIQKLDTLYIIEVFSKILSFNFPNVVCDFINSTLEIFSKRGKEMLRFIVGISRNMQPSTNISDDKVTIILIKSLIKYIEPGKRWEYLRNLILKMAFPTPDIIELILRECLEYPKSPQDIDDIEKNIINNLDENILVQINSLIMNNFMKLVDNSNLSAKQHNKTAVVASIASPDLINNNNSNRIIANEQNGGITNNTPIMKGISLNLRKRLGTKQHEDDLMKWKLVKIDNINEPNSVYKKRLGRLHEDLELLSIALDKKNYDTIVGILTTIRSCSLQEDILAYGKGFYEILCNSIMDSPEHLEKLMLLTENDRVPHYLSTMLTNIGINILQKLINFGAWIIAKKLLKIFHYYHGKTNLVKNCNEFASASFILLSAEIYIANQRPVKAFELIKQNNLMKKERSEWKVVSEADDEKWRIIILKLLLKSLSSNHVEHAFLLYTTILKDQNNSFTPLDLSIFTDCIILGLLRDSKNDILIEMIDLIFEYFLFASPMIIRSMIRKIFHLNEILSRRLFIYALGIGIYPSVKRLKNVQHFIITIDIDWTEEEMYLIVEDYLHALHREPGNHLRNIRSRKSLIFVNFQQIHPSSKQLYDDYVSNDKFKNFNLMANAKKKMQNALRRFNPQLRINQNHQSHNLCKFIGTTVVNYINKRYRNDTQTK